MSAEPTTWSFSQRFTVEFQAFRTDLDSRLAAAKTSPTPKLLQELSIKVAQLSKSLADATGSLPSYDQRLYENQIKALEREIDELRTASAPKSKFSFRRKFQTGSPEAVPSPIISHSSNSSIPPEEAPTKSSPLPIQPPSEPSLSFHLAFKALFDRYLTLKDLPLVSGSSAPDLTISDLKNCVVNLLPQCAGNGLGLTFSALHIRNLSNCVLLLPFIEGSALIHDLENCVLVLGCHQFRMHTSHIVDVYLKIASNPIIEDCRNIRFATYPSKLAPQLLHDAPLPRISVQDFSHIRATPSPNFSLMIDKSDNEEKPWPMTILNSEGEIAEVLRRTLPDYVS